MKSRWKECADGERTRNESKFEKDLQQTQNMKLKKGNHVSK